MTPEEFIPYLRGLLDAQQEETPLVKLLKKKVAEVEIAPKYSFPTFKRAIEAPIAPLKDSRLPYIPVDDNKPYC